MHLSVSALDDFFINENKCQSFQGGSLLAKLKKPTLPELSQDVFLIHLDAILNPSLGENLGTHPNSFWTDAVSGLPLFAGINEY